MLRNICSQCGCTGRDLLFVPTAAGMLWRCFKHNPNVPKDPAEIRGQCWCGKPAPFRSSIIKTAFVCGPHALEEVGLAGTPDNAGVAVSVLKSGQVTVSSVGYVGTGDAGNREVKPQPSGRPSRALF